MIDLKELSHISDVFGKMRFYLRKGVCRGILFALIFFLPKMLNAQTGDCGDATDFGVINSTSLNCGGEVVTRNITATGPDWNDPTEPGADDVIEVFISWGDGSPVQIVPLAFIGGPFGWAVSATHTYPDNGPLCVYDASALLRVNSTICNGIPDLLDRFEVIVFDELDNPNTGTHLLEHEPTSTGVDNGNIVEVCQGDTAPVRFRDESEFNCTDPLLIDPVSGTDNRNREARWVQYEYGTTSNITGDVTIGGVAVNAAALPYRGEIFYIGNDPDAPLNREITLDIQMPATAIVGEQFEVTLRSWNVCNPYDDDVLDGDELNPVGGVFDPEVEPIFGVFPNAIEAPVITSHFIEIIERPLDPNPVPQVICNGTDLTTVDFEITTPGASTEINWYDSDPRLPGANELPDPGGNNNSTTYPAEDFPAPGIDNTVAGTYSLFATYVQAGINDCESDPVQVDLTILPELTQPDAPTGPSVVCLDDQNVSYQIATLPDPGTRYRWTLTGATGSTIDGTNIGQFIDIDFNETPPFTSRVLTLSIFQEYITPTTNGDRCPSPARVFDIVVSGGPTATVVGGGAVCNNNPAADIIWTFNSDFSPPFTFTYEIDSSAVEQITVTNHPLNTFTIPSPQPTIPTTYRLISLTDSAGCTSTTNLGGDVTITIGGIPPALENITPPADVCDAGMFTVIGPIIIDLDVTTFPTQFVVEYTIDGGALQVDTLSTIDNTGEIRLIPDYVNDLGAPGTYTYNISIVRDVSTGCAGLINVNADVTVNPLPGAPTNPMDAIACTSDLLTAQIQVDDPGAGFQILWYTAPTGGAPIFTGNVFTPGALGPNTYYAENQIIATGCVSATRVPVTLIEDIEPTIIDGGPDQSSCDEDFVMAAINPNNGGRGSWSIANVLYAESFTNIPVGTMSDGTMVDNDFYGWAIDTTAGDLSLVDDYFEVRNERMESRDSNGEMVFFSSSFDVSAITQLTISMDVAQSGDLDTGGADPDFFSVFIQFDMGAEQLVGTQLDGNFVAVQIQELVNTGGATNARLVIRLHTNGGNEIINFDNILVVADPAGILISDVNDPNAQVLNITDGSSNTFFWNVTSELGACTIAPDPVVIQRFALPELVNPQPVICADDEITGQANIADLSLALDAIVSPTNPGNWVIEYFSDPGRTVLITSAAVSDQDTIYTRITDPPPVGFGCFRDSIVSFTIDPLPVVVDTVVVLCEDSFIGGVHSDDAAGQNLLALETKVSDGAAGVDVSWFENFDPVTRIFTGLIPPGVLVGQEQNYTATNTIIFARIETFATGCINAAEVQFIVNRRPDDNLIEDPNGTMQPNGSQLRFCVGDEFQVFRVPSNPGSSYQWTVPPQFDFNPISTLGDTAFFVVLDFNTVVTTPLTLELVETSADGCPGNRSFIDIAVDALPSAPTVLGPAEVCANELGVVFSIDAPSATSTYNWTLDGALGSLVQNNNSSIVVNIGSIPTTGTPFNITVTESIGNNCEGAATIFMVDVRQLPDLAPVEVTVCSNENTGVTFADSGGSVTLADSYTISNLTVETGLVPSAANNISNTLVFPITGQPANVILNDSFENTTSSQLSVFYTVSPVTVLPNSRVCEGTPQIIRVRIDPEPVLASNLDQERCSNEAFGALLAVAPGSAPASIFNITVVPGAGLVADPGNQAGGPVFTGVGANFLLGERYLNTTANPIDVVYNISPIGSAPNNCVGDPPVAVVFTILPQPVGTDSIFSIVCSESSFDIDLQPLIQNSLNSSFSWTASYGPNISGGVGSGSGNIIETLTNNSLVRDTVFYNVLPTSFPGVEDCVGDAFTVGIPIEPSPVANDLNLEVCSITSGGTLAQVDLTLLELAVSPGGFTVTWFANAALTSPIADPMNHVVDAAFPFVFAEVDDGFCQAAAQVTYIVNPSPSLTASVTTELDCPGFDNAVITALAAEGTGPYVYTIRNSLGDSLTSNGDGVFDNSDFITHPTITGITADTYSISVVDDNNCTATVGNIQVIPPPAIVATAQSSITYIGGLDISCFGESDGRITITASGGTGALEYDIVSGPGATAANVTGLFSGIFSNLPAGIYNLTVTDDNSCIFNLPPLELFEPAPLSASSRIVNNVTCNSESDGTIEVTNQTGGNGPYTYLLEEDRNNTSGETTGIFTGLRAGSYTVRITDQNGCVFVTSPPLDVTEPDRLDLSIDVTSSFGSLMQEISCIGESDGEITITNVTGGTMPYTFTIKNDVGDSLTSISDPDRVFDQSDFIGHPTLTGLTDGTYFVRVTDVNGCTFESFPVRIDPPFELNGGFISGDQNICVGDTPFTFGELTAPIGGIGDYTYQWQISTVAPDAGFTDVVGATSSTYSAPPFAPGPDLIYYFRRLTSSGSAAQCVDAASNTITVNVNPGPSDVQIIAPEAVCQGDAFTFQIVIQGGTGPFRFDYEDDKGNSFTDVFGADTSLIFVLDGEFLETTTYRVTRVQDINTCELFPANATATVEAVELDASFSIIGPTDGCSPTTIEFEFNQISGVNYVWNWFDGTPNETINATVDDPNRRIFHTFANGTPTTTFNYGVTLDASDTLIASSGSQFICTDQSMQNVTIYPTVIAIVTTQDTPVCSGDQISFTNQSQGANNHRWFYREEGNAGQELDVQIVRNPTFIIDNPGPNNPQRYEVIYQGFTDNGGGNICSASDTTIVEVYRDIIPDFTFGPLAPVFIAGSAQVTFANTSTPNNDPLNFEYNWNFDDGILLQDTPQPGVITYTQPGLKTVTLDIVNKVAPGACDVSITQNFTIQDVPIVPDFEVTPTKGCIPTTITITNRTVGSANEFTWAVFDDNNITVFESIQLAQPGSPILPIIELDLFNAGVYSVSLTARNTITNQRETLIKDEIVTIFPTPLASFDVRPDVVFIPDQPLTTFNFSEGEPGQEYFWDFGDGGTSFEFDPVHVYTVEGEYDIMLVAFNDYGDGVVCADTLVRPISVREGGSTRIPNAFTPNTGSRSGDGRIQNEVDNDIFLPITSGVEEFNMLIFDRWGNLIFESNDKNVGWDGYDANGNLLPAGVYVFRLTLRLSNGERSSRIGDVTLIR